MKNLKIFFYSLSLVVFYLSSFSSICGQAPTILVDGNSVLVSSEAKFPFWLNSGKALSLGQAVVYISVIEYNITGVVDNKQLHFGQVKTITTSETVPSGKAWKVEGVLLSPTATSPGSEGRYTVDCAGVIGGAATIDGCGTCVVGTTGLSACLADCNGDLEGIATLDGCGTCVGGNTGQTACVSDADGNSYATVQMGAQVWMSENLKTTKYADGSDIPNVTDTTQWSVLSTGAWSHYANDNQYETPYGRLYNWYAVNSGTLCPTGWGVPSDADWTTLTDHLGGLSVAGGKMKETGTTHWNPPNTDATNESGFSGLPGGYRDANGDFGSIGDAGFWWSSSEYSTDDAWYRLLGTFHGFVYRLNYFKGSGFSVRCLRD